MTFTHLEVHSHFTLLGATPTVPELIARGQADGMSHLALTDTNALYGVVAFHRACRAAGIRPIIGMTVTVARPVPGRSTSHTDIEGAGHLVLLAIDRDGYRCLCRLSSHIQGSPQREQLAAQGLTLDQIAAHCTGLICLSGGRRGWLERFLRAGDLASALNYAGRLAGIFEENAFLALELHHPEDEAVAVEVAALGRRLGLPTVAVQPIYCLAPEDTVKLRLLAAIRENRRLQERAEAEDKVEARAEAENARKADVIVSALYEDVHWLAPAEMAARFAHFPDALAQAGAIARRCGDCLPDGRPIWPSLRLPAGQTPDEALAALAFAGSRKLEAGAGGAPPPATKAQAEAQSSASSTQLPTSSIQSPASSTQPAASSHRDPAMRARLQHELDAIARHGYAPLFLVVADIVRFARERGIPVSTRGSVANSLVAYCCGITTVDPIRHNLLFERFLNPARAGLPDIDLDFCSRRRDEVLRYVQQAYGTDRVALVCTFSTLRLQSAVRETGKAYGLDEATMDRLAGMMPGRWHPDPRRRDQRTQEEVLAQIQDPEQRKVVLAAWGLVGQPDHLSVHPGAVVITPGPLTDFVPVQWAPKGFLVTQFEHGDVEAIGLPKMDLLGVRALTVLADTVEMIRRFHDPDFRLEQIPPDDPATGDLLARGETIGVFQCESEGAQRTLRKLRARTVSDLAIANAFFKPGPAMGGMADAFVRRYRGEEAVTYLHPALAPILGPTKGVLIFQEQVLRLATEIAGLDWAQADQIRRGMSHFGPQEMEAVREQFIAGCQRPPPTGPGFTPAQARALWDQITPFAGYGFNQGHATAYADVSYRSAYLKAHYPAEFFCARLADRGGFHHPVIYAAEAIRLGIPIRPPHVNFSGEAFTLLRIADFELQIEPPNRSERGQSSTCNPPSAILYMGLGQVRDLRHSAVEAIVAARAEGPYASLRDLVRRVRLQPKELDHLIRCGALDGLGESRAALLAEAALLKRKEDALQLAFDFVRPTATAESPAQRLAWEQTLLGWPVSVHPLALVADRLPDHLPLRRLAEHPGKTVTVVGVRLPGWTGGPGFFLGDGDTFIIVRAGRDHKAPSPWQPLILHGRWMTDPWGGGWYQAETMRLLAGDG